MSWGSFTVHHIIPGVVGSLLIALGALGVGWLPLNTGLLDNVVVDALRSTTFGVGLSKVSVLVGVALLLQAWLVLGYDVLHGRTERGAAWDLGPQPLRRLWVALGAWMLPLLLTPPLFSRDVYSYYAQGKLLGLGVSPYTSGVASVPGWFNDGVDPMWGEAPAPYGPLFLLIERLVAGAAGSHPMLAAYLFRLVAIGGVALVAWGVPVIARQMGIDPVKAFWLAVLNPLVLMHFVAGIHNDALTAGLLVVGFAVAMSGRGTSRAAWAVPAGVALVAMAGAVKPIGLLALPFVALLWAPMDATWGQRIKAWVKAFVVFALVFGVLSLITGTGLGWIDALSTPGAVRTWLSPPTAIGMVLGAATDAVGLASVDAMVSIMRVVGQIIGLALVAWLAFKPQGRSAVRGAALALLVVVVFGPVVQPWYLLWSLPLFVASGLSRPELRVVLFGTAILTMQGIASSSATSDTLWEASEGLTLLAITGGLLLLIGASRRERRLLLGEPGDIGISPETPAAQLMHDSWTVRLPAKGPRADQRSR